MKLSLPKTEQYHGHDEGDCSHPINRKVKHLLYYKKGFWKRNDRKKYYRDFFNKVKI